MNFVGKKYCEVLMVNLNIEILFNLFLNGINNGKLLIKIKFFYSLDVCVYILYLFYFIFI